MIIIINITVNVPILVLVLIFFTRPSSVREGTPQSD